MCESMSLRSTHNNGLTADNVTNLLGGDLYAKRAVELLLKYCNSGTIPSKELDEELVLLLDFYKLAVPISAIHGSLSWRMRLLAVEDMEIPYVIRFFFRLLKSGRADWKKAIERYFASIGEKNPYEFVEIFIQISERAKSLVVCGEDIVDISMKYGRDGGVVIAEMKGAGLISPSVGCGGFGKAKAPLYELNRFFALLVDA